MFGRVLIANRAEIVGRIARTAARLGISTVGVYSEPDANAVHVEQVDLAVALGGSTPADSYLRIERIVEAALATGAEAVHPGYGFLAERADFAQAVIDAGLTWIGPRPDQIALLGDKVAAKRAAIEAGVPTSPMTEVAVGQVPSGLSMPVLVKAAAGGGGRGMRIVRGHSDLAAAIDEARREAASAFGDDTVFIEPFVERGRHVEVQIMGDSHGNVVHLGERECSIQRRNQKLVEEAPSAGISDHTRRSLTDGALALARRVGYVNAGTVEFLVAPDGTISFLEVNTRLQVEHPVTEAVTGLDLVELQLRVAAGERLPIDQDDISVDGHAIEVRVVAEDPEQGWLPSTGAITAFRPGDGIRVDSGFDVGSVVAAEYDSMLAKFIGHGRDRVEAARILRRALRGTDIGGIATNVSMLAAVLDEPDFLEANTPTTYLDEHPEVVAGSGPSGDDRLALLLAAVFAWEARNVAANPVTAFAPSGWRNLATTGQRRTLIANGVDHHFEYIVRGSSATVRVGPWPAPDEDGSVPPDTRRTVEVRVLDRHDESLALELDGVRRRVSVRIDGDTAQTSSTDGAMSVELAPTFRQADIEHATGGPVCPLPGTVLAVHVEPGQRVQEGDLLMVVEAMKMEHKIIADLDATVAAISFAAGDRVDAGDVLLELVDPEES